MHSENLKPQNETRYGRGLLAVAVASAVVLMLVGGRATPLLLDEHVSYWIAGSENPGTLSQRSLDYSATPPLSFAVQALFVSESSSDPLLLRLGSWIGFALAVGLVFLAGRRAAGPLCGGIAAILLAWHPEVLDLMRVGRPYGLSVGFAALSLWLLFRYLDSPQSYPRVLLLALSQIALIWTHYLNAPLVLVEWVILFSPGFSFRLSGESPSRGTLILLVLLVSLTSIPLLNSILRLEELAEFLNYRDTPVAFLEAIHPVWWVGVPVGVLFCLGLRGKEAPPANEKIHKRHGLFVAFMLLGLVPIVALWLLSQWSQPALGELRYRAVYAPASALLIALILCRVSLSSPFVIAGAIGCLIAGWSFSDEVPWKSKLLADPAAGDWQQIATQIEEEGSAGEPIFVHSGLIESRLVAAFYPDPLFHDYVACRVGRFYLHTEHPRIALPWSWTPPADLVQFYRGQLQVTHNQGQSVWILTGTDTDLGRAVSSQFALLLQQAGFVLDETTEFGTALLSRFVPLSEDKEN